MDKIKDPHPGDDGNDGDDPVVDPVHPFGSKEEEKERHEHHSAYTSEQNIHASKNSRWHKFKKRFTERWEQTSWDRRAELFIALLIAVFAGLQFGITRSNNASASQQTDQLIAAAKYSAYAADRNANAAASFAQSADGIKQGVGNAVQRLGSQAQETGSIADSSAQQTRDASAALQIQTQPWIGISSFKPVSEEISFPGSQYKIDWKFDVSVMNYGGFPARRVIVGVDTYTGGGESEGLTWKTYSPCGGLKSEILTNPNLETIILYPKQAIQMTKTLQLSGPLPTIKDGAEIRAYIVYVGSLHDVHCSQFLYVPKEPAENIKFKPIGRASDWNRYSIYELMDSDTDK